MNAYGIASVNDVEIHPAARHWYTDEPQSHIDAAMEQIYEWDYASDPHGYCHERSMIWGLIREIERLRDEKPAKA